MVTSDNDPYCAVDAAERLAAGRALLAAFTADIGDG
jgi:hypothetical protein